MKRRSFLIALPALWLAGCATPEAQPDRYFRLSLAPPKPRQPLPARLIIEPFEVQGLYADRAMVYRAADGSYQQYHHQNWIAAPSQMFTSDLVAALRATYGAASAFPASSRLEGEVTVRGRVRRLERLLDGGGARAALALSLAVTTRGGQLLGSLEFERELEAGKTINDYVATQAQLCTLAYDQLFDLLDQQISTLARR